MLKKFLNIKISAPILAGLVVFVFLNNMIPPSPQISYQRTAETGEMIIVYFPDPISEAEAINSFTVTPAIAGETEWLGEYRQLNFIPHEGFVPGLSYSVTVKHPSLFAQMFLGDNKQVFQSNELPTKFNVRVANEPTIYYITESGLKRPITPDVFNSYPDNREEDIQETDKETLNLYPDNTLIHLNNDHDIYKLENGIKRFIKNPETFNALGLNWKAIASVNQYEFNSYPEGEPLQINNILSPNAPRGKFVDVDTEAMKLTLWENGVLIEELPVAGKGNPRTSPTKKGFFTIQTKEVNHFSSISKVWMPLSMRYSGNYFIHGWPYWPSGAQLKSQYSGGCVRLTDENAKKVYSFVEIGTPVLIR